MAVWTVGDHINVAVVHLWDDISEQINVFDFRVSTGTVDTEAALSADLCDTMTEVYESIESLISGRVACTEIRWRNVTENGPTIFAPWTGTYVGGTGSGDAMAPQNAALILLRTGVLGVQGKKYLPTFTEATQSGGVVTSGALSAMTTFANALSEDLELVATAGAITPCVFSRKLGTLHTVIGAQPRAQLAVQRGRRVGHGS